MRSTSNRTMGVDCFHTASVVPDRWSAGVGRQVCVPYPPFVAERPQCDPVLTAKSVHWSTLDGHELPFATGRFRGIPLGRKVGSAHNRRRMSRPPPSMARRGPGFSQSARATRPPDLCLSGDGICRLRCSGDLTPSTNWSHHGPYSGVGRTTVRPTFQ
jgi:hypothetical protein